MAATTDRLLPHSLEAEEYLLSCCFIDGADVIAKASAAGITPSSFYEPKHAIVFDVLCFLLKSGKPTEVSNVAEELKATGQLESIGGFPFLAQVSSRVPTTAQAEYFLEKVLTAARRREMIRAAEKLAESLRDESTELASIDMRLPANFSKRFPAVEEEPGEKEILPDVQQIIDRILEAGDKLVLSSGSKSFKTWTLIQLCMAISTGTPWLGFATRKQRVLFLNFEIKPLNFWKRVYRVRRALGLSQLEGFTVWNLRGRGFSMDAHADELIRQAKAVGAGVIVLDPIYKLFGDRNESSAGDMATLMTIFDRVATESGAAIVFAHHFAKGSAAAKDAIDRASGSGVFARDPDCIITLTRLNENEAENSFAVDVTLREFAPVDRFAVRREHPLMIRDDNLNPTNLHESGGRQSKYSPKQLVDLLPQDGDGISVGEWRDLAAEKCGMTRSTFFEHVRQAKKQAKTKDNRWLRTAA